MNNFLNRVCTRTLRSIDRSVAGYVSVIPSSPVRILNPQCFVMIYITVGRVFLVSVEIKAHSLGVL